MSFINYYATLNIDRDATDAEIQQAFEAEIKRTAQEDAHRKEMLREAFSILSNPEKRRVFNQSLHEQEQSESRPSNKNERPKYKSKNNYYYTKGTKLKGTIFVLIFISAAILVPISLSYYSSQNHYERGLELLAANQIDQARTEFDEAILFLGAKSTEASIQNACINFYHKNNLSSTKVYIDLGLKYAEFPRHIGFLYFLQSKLEFKKQQFSQSLISLTKADSMGYNSDSIHYYNGLLNGFYLKNFEVGLGAFTKCINQGVNLEQSYFGQGWCYQNLGNNESAIRSFTSALEHGESPTTHYYKAIGHLALKEDSIACQHFYRSHELGLRNGTVYYQHSCLGQDSVVLYQIKKEIP